MSARTRVNVQKLVSAIALTVTVFALAVQPMQPVLAFYLVAGSNALNAGLQLYFGTTNPDPVLQKAPTA